MPQVAVQINGKTYRMACDEGQEAHLLDLAQRFDQYIDNLKGSFGEIGDQRLTVMAGVMVTDELVEMKHKVRGLEQELAALRTNSTEVAATDANRERHLAEALNNASEQLNQITRKLSATT